MLRFFIGLLFATKRRFLPTLDIALIFPWFDSAVSWLAGKAKADFVADVHGHKMFLDRQDSLRLSFTTNYEPYETDFFRKHIRSGDVVVDLGANIGYYTLLFAKQAGPAGQVFAFEPETENFSLLEKNVRLNGYENVRLERRAVSDRSELLPLFINENNRADHRLFPEREDGSAVLVEAIRLDDYFADRDQGVDVVKMDIQGAEYRALDGMQNVLKNNPHVLLITEFWPHALEQAQCKSSDFLQLLLSLNFELFELNEQKRRIELVSAEQLLKRFTPQNRAFTNLLCRRPPRQPAT